MIPIGDLQLGRNSGQNNRLTAIGKLNPFSTEALYIQLFSPGLVTFPSTCLLKAWFYWVERSML
jgi:hypothetical protein